MAYRLWYTTVYARDFAKLVDFYANTVGLPLKRREDDFGYASFDTGFCQLSIARLDPDDPNIDALSGRHTGLGLAVDDLAAAHADLAAKGVEFPMPPTQQPWGGTIALMADPEGNILFLDEYAEEKR